MSYCQSNTMVLSIYQLWTGCVQKLSQIQTVWPILMPLSVQGAATVPVLFHHHLKSCKVLNMEDMDHCRSQRKWPPITRQVMWLQVSEGNPICCFWVCGFDACHMYVLV